MKRPILTAAFLLGMGFFTLLASAEPRNTDCYVAIDQLSLVHGCFVSENPGPGLCESWLNHGPIFYAPLNRTSLNHYELTSAQFGLNVSVVFDGKSSAQISIEAPHHVNQSKLVGVTYERSDVTHHLPDAQSEVQYGDYFDQQGLAYRVSCTFGLSDEVNALNAADESQMNALGPAQEWHDPAAPSVSVLPVGTILELSRDMDIQPGSGTALTKFVEQNGLMTEVGFEELKLPYRFAYADFFNANNSFLSATHYPKGMRLEVIQVVTKTFASGGHSFDILVKVASLPKDYAGTIDPITRITATGRRSGSGDLKIPQLEALLAPAMSLELPH